MRTTININDAILADLRNRAAHTGASFRETVEHSLELGLATLDKSAKQRRFTVRPHALGMKSGFRGVSLNQLYDQSVFFDLLKPAAI